MIYLFVHQNFPGQYRNLARYLADVPGNTVYFITQRKENWMRGVTKIPYEPQPRAENLNCHPYTVDFDNAVRNGLAVAEICRNLRDRGIQPDLIAGHQGWGETMFIKDVFPDGPLLSYFEFFYHHADVDVGFDPEYPGVGVDPFRLRTRNAVNWLSFDAADWGNTPTRWQRSTYPPEMRPRISVLHEGVDTGLLKPNPNAWLRLGREPVILTRKDEVITYVARNLEPYRGFHTFMRAVPEIHRRRPSAHVLVVGGDGVSYGAPAPGGIGYRELLMREVGNDIDPARLHFLGQIPYEAYVNVLQLSSAHIYLTYPFVLSWSFIEAMAVGCAMVGSATPPVLEVLQDGVNGLAFDFFLPHDIADRVDMILDHPDRMQAMGDAARKTAVTNFDFESCLLPKWLALFEDLRNTRRPPTNA
jgi:glycosyltransferase involved in cell wall biosynthesis